MVWPTIVDKFNSRVQPSCVAPKQLAAAAAADYLDHLCELNVDSAPAGMRLTGLICSIGPASLDVNTMEKMMETGMNVARVNLCLGTRKDHVEMINNLNTAAENYGKRLGMPYPLGIALDTKGSIIRTGYIDPAYGTEIELKKGAVLKLTVDPAYQMKGNASVLFVDPEVLRLLHSGCFLYLDHGLMRLICTNIQGAVLTCTVDIGGMLGSRKSVHIPGRKYEVAGLSEEDKDDLRFAAQENVHMIFASFVRNAAGINEIRDVLSLEEIPEKRMLIFAKIANIDAVHNLDEIIRVADGILISRGDLGIELAPHKVFLIQKSAIAKCNKMGKPVICAYQFLHSMMHKPLPNRSDCSDIANAVFDGVDCIMTSGETAKGDFPVDSIHVLSDVCKEAESAMRYRDLYTNLVSKVIPPLDTDTAVAIASIEASRNCEAAAIIVLTTSGKAAYIISQYRPRCPIVAITRFPYTAAQAHLYRGVLPLLYNIENIEENEKNDLEARINYGISFGKWKGFIRSGDPVIVIHGFHAASGSTSVMKILYVLKSIDKIELYECGEEMAA